MRQLLLAGLITAVLGALDVEGKHHHHHSGGVAWAQTAILRAVHGAARLANGTEEEMHRCASALAGARDRLAETKESVDKAREGLQAVDGQINATETMHASTEDDLAAREERIEKQSAKASKLESSVTAFARKIEIDQSRLRDAKHALFKRVKELRNSQEEMRRNVHQMAITDKALQRMRSWNHIDQVRLTWEQEKLQDKRKQHQLLKKHLAIEVAEVRHELLGIEKQVQAWDAKKFLLADLLSHVQATKQEIAKKKHVYQEGVEKKQELAKLLRHRAEQRAQQHQTLQKAQKEYNHALESVVAEQQERLAEDKKTITRLRASKTKHEEQVHHLESQNYDTENTLKIVGDQKEVAEAAARNIAMRLAEQERDTADMVLEHDQRIAKLVSERQTEVAARDAKIAKLLKELDQEVGERDAKVAELEDQLVKTDVVSQEQDGVIASQREDIGEAREHITAQKDALKKLSQAYGETQEDLTKCLVGNANMEDSEEAKDVFAAVKGVVGDQDGEIMGTIKKAIQNGLGNGHRQHSSAGADTFAPSTSGPEPRPMDVQQFQRSLEGLRALNVPPKASDAWPPKEDEVLTGDFQELVGRLRGESAGRAPPSGDGLKESIVQSWGHVADARQLQSKSAHLPGELSEKVRRFAEMMHDVHYGMGGLACALNKITDATEV